MILIKLLKILAIVKAISKDNKRYYFFYHKKFLQYSQVSFSNSGFLFAFWKKKILFSLAFRLDSLNKNSDEKYNNHVAYIRFKSHVRIIYSDMAFLFTKYFIGIIIKINK